MSLLARAAVAAVVPAVLGAGGAALAAEPRWGAVVLGGGAAGAEAAGEAAVGGGAVTLDLPLGGRWGVTVEGWPLLLWRRETAGGGERETVAAFAVDGLLTFDAGPRAGRWRVRLEAGVGPMWATDPVPARGSRWNFFDEEGVRLLWRFGDGSVGSIGYRFVHVSNGRSSGERNPGLNVHALAVGCAFR